MTYNFRALTIPLASGKRGGGLTQSASSGAHELPLDNFLSIPSQGGYPKCPGTVLQQVSAKFLNSQQAKPVSMQVAKRPFTTVHFFLPSVATHASFLLGSLGCGFSPGC